MTGRVATIATMPRDTAWRVTVQFPQGLQTSAHKRLPFRNGMGATAEIVTEDISLFERFFYELRRLIR